MRTGERSPQLSGSDGRPPGWKRVLRFMAGVVLVGFALLLLRYGDSYFRVGEIRVEGLVDLNYTQVVTAGNLRLGRSMFSIREQSTADLIRQTYPQVKNVVISRVLPGTVIVTVVERVPAAYVLTASGYWMIDDDTVCLGRAAEPVVGYPLVAGLDENLMVPGEAIRCRRRRESLKNYFAAWEQRDDSWPQVTVLDISTRYNLVLKCADGLEIWLGDGKEMDNKLFLVQASIPYIEPGDFKYYDVRSGNRLVVSGSAFADETGVDH